MVRHLRIHPHLHRTAEELRTFGRTYAGQAAPAGTGPVNTHCSQCKFWNFFQKRVSSNPQKAAPCGVYRKRQGFVGPAVPGSALSCDQFLHVAAPAPSPRPNSPAPQQTSFLPKT
jgi:hypothetical protein